MPRKKTAIKYSKTKAQKASESGVKTWVCHYGCKDSTSPCKHLEKLIQEPASTSVQAIPTDKIDQFYYDSGAGIIVPKEIKDRTWELAFRDKLLKAGLSELKSDILVNRFIYDMTLVEIATEMEFVSASAVLRLLSDSLKFLKRVGFPRRKAR